MNKKANSKYQAILLAAGRVLKKKGVSNLTLDEVALEAGVSKGGLLYHFPSKDALIGGIIRYLCDNFSETFTRFQSTQKNVPGKKTKAYIEASMISNEQSSSELIIILLTAFASNPALLDPLRQKYTEWDSELLIDGIDPIKALIIRLAIDGLWITDLMSFNVPDNQTREAIKNRLLEMASV